MVSDTSLDHTCSHDVSPTSAVVVLGLLPYSSEGNLCSSPTSTSDISSFVEDGSAKNSGRSDFTASSKVKHFPAVQSHGIMLH